MSLPTRLSRAAAPGAEAEANAAFVRRGVPTTLL